MNDADARSRIPARLLNAELTCPICLSIVRTAHTFLERACGPHCLGYTLLLLHLDLLQRLHFYP
jgi:hypothetical protein